MLWFGKEERLDAKSASYVDLIALFNFMIGSFETRMDCVLFECMCLRIAGPDRTRTKRRLALWFNLLINFRSDAIRIYFVNGKTKLKKMD